MPVRSKALHRSALVLLGVIVMGLATAPASGASDSFGYGGRVTDQTGAPISGPVDLAVNFFRAASGGDPLLGSPLSFPKTPLANGVFQLSLVLGPADFATVFSDVAAPVFIEVTDATHQKTYPRQQFLMVPFAGKVPVDGQTVSFNAQGQLTVGPSYAPGANEFLTKDASGNFVWGTPSTAASSIAGAAVGATSPTSGQLLMYTGGQWQAVNDPGIQKTGDSGIGSLVLAPASMLGLGTFTADPAGLTAADKGKTWFNTTTDQIKYWDGAAAQVVGAAGSGLQNLNGATGNTQTFAVPGTAGLSPGWVTNTATNTHTLNLPLAAAAGVTAGLLANTDYQSFQGKVAKAGDTMTGSLGIGTTSASSLLDVAGAVTLRSQAAPGGGTTGLARLYFDSVAQQLLVSQNGGSYVPVATLAPLGAAGTYAKVSTDSYGRVTAGTSLTVADLPAIPMGQLGGTLSTAQLPTIPVTQLGGTLATTQLPIIPVAQLGGTLSTAQLPTIPVTQLGGTLATTQLPIIPVAQLGGTLTASQMPSLAQLAGTLQAGQLPALSAGQVTSGTLAVALGGTGATGWANNALLVGGGTAITALSAGSSGNVLVGGSGGAPTWGQVNLGQSSAVSGTLPVTSGGTGSNAALTGGRVIVSSGAALVETSGLSFVGDSLGIGTVSPGSALDVNGALTARGMAPPAAAPAGQGRLYFDTTANAFLVSQNGGAYTPLSTGGLTGVSAGVGLTGGGTTGSVSLALLGVGTAGTYTKVLTDAYGRVTAGTTLVTADLPPVPAALVTGSLAATQLSGTLATTTLPSLPAGLITGSLAATQISGTFAATQLPSLSLLSGSLAATQISGSLAATQIAGTLAAAQIPSLSQLSGTVAASSVPWATPGTIGATTPNTGAFTTLTTTGSVGIGTLSPGATLDVAGGPIVAQFTADGADSVINLNNNYTGAHNWALDNMKGSAAGTGFSIFDRTAATSRLNIDLNGDVGIGTSVPGGVLDVEHTFTNVGGVAMLSTPTQTGTTSGTYYNQGLHIYTNTNLGAGVTNSGYFNGLVVEGLRENADAGTLAQLNAVWLQYGNYAATTGLTTAVAGLHLTPYHGTGSITNSYGILIDPPGTTGATVTNYYGLYQTDAAAKNYFSGNVGIGTTSPTAALDVVGNIHLSGNIQQSVPMIYVTSTSSIGLTNTGSFADLSTFLSLTTNLANGISLSGSTFTFPTAGTYLVSFGMPFNTSSAAAYLVVRARRTSGTPATLATFSSWGDLAGAFDGQTALIQVAANDTVDFQAATNGTVGWGSTSVDGEATNSLSLTILKVQ